VELATEKEAGPENWAASIRRRVLAFGVRPPLLARVLSRASLSGGLPVIADGTQQSLMSPQTSQLAQT
jgi:hypothetical protein